MTAAGVIELVDAPGIDKSLGPKSQSAKAGVLAGWSGGVLAASVCQSGGAAIQKRGRAF